MCHNLETYSMASLAGLKRDWINNKIEAQQVVSENRGYLGMSQLGHSCSRYLYYVHRQVGRDSFSPRTMRIFERGHWEEHRVIRDLESIGIQVVDTQLEILLLDGRVRGHIDGIAIIEGKRYLLEIKTMNDAAWKKYYKLGIHTSNPAYWAQAQSYAAEVPVDGILFCAVNKNDECRKFEFVDLEPTNYLDRAVEITTMTEPPSCIGGPDWWECKMCSFNNTCHGE